MHGQQNIKFVKQFGTWPEAYPGFFFWGGGGYIIFLAGGGCDTDFLREWGFIPGIFSEGFNKFS
jgi:hypothetical protein